MPAKPGIKTSEMWTSLSVIAAMLTAAFATGDKAVEMTAVIVSGVVVALYSCLRNQTKNEGGQPPSE